MKLRVYIKPNAKQSRIHGKRDDGTFVIALKAPAREGKANKALIELLADKLGIAKSLIEIKHGHKGREKLVEVPDSAQTENLVVS